MTAFQSLNINSFSGLSAIKHLFTKKEEPKATQSKKAVLEFTEEYVTWCLENNKPIFQWRGDRGPVSDYELNPVAGNWKLYIVKTGHEYGHVSAHPTGRRTMGIHRESKVREWLALGIDEAFSRIYMRRTRFIRYANEKPTVTWIWKNFLMPKEHLNAISSSPDPRATCRELGYPVKATARHFENWVKIIYALRESDSGFNLALQHREMPKDHATAIFGAESPKEAAVSLGYDTMDHPDHIVKKMALLILMANKSA